MTADQPRGLGLMRVRISMRTLAESVAVALSPALAFFGLRLRVHAVGAAPGGLASRLPDSGADLVSPVRCVAGVRRLPLRACARRGGARVSPVAPPVRPFRGRYRGHRHPQQPGGHHGLGNRLPQRGSLSNKTPRSGPLARVFRLRHRMHRARQTENCESSISLGD